MRTNLCLTIVALVILSGWPNGIASETTERHIPGQDIAAVFARAQAGMPLRYVALGGSITEGGQGWIGPWLKEKFPKSDVSVINSGMSATGSALGVFRVERDVIEHQPDLVAIEYCVNDGRLSDEEAIRYMESLVVRLKSLPHPPAILIIEAAAEEGVNLERHRRVAQHYGLLEVDLQAAVNTELAEDARPWTTFFKDAVHPNTDGHAFYARTIEAALDSQLDTQETKSEKPLPPPLSKKPLLLDGEMISLAGRVAEENWKTEPALAASWTRFFNGVLSANKPKSVLQIPFRGTAVGVVYAMDPAYGTFYASIDSGNPQQILTNTREGYSYSILATDLPAMEHSLTLVLPPDTHPVLRQSGPIKLGHLLVAGTNDASSKQAPLGNFHPNDIAAIEFTPLEFEQIRWSGPYSKEGFSGKDALSLMDEIMPPEQEASATTEWQSWPKSNETDWDFHELFQNKTPAIAYVSAEIHAPSAGQAWLAIEVDYFAKIWLNGELVEKIVENHGPASAPVLVQLQLRKGMNSLLIKAGAGTQGHRLKLSAGSASAPTP